MNATNRTSRTSDLVSLAQATDATGQVDLGAYQAYRLINAHQTLDGMDAAGVVDAIMASPVYADERGRAQVGQLIEAISSRLPPADARRFDAALDAAQLDESWVERNYERYVEEPLGAAAHQAKGGAGAGAGLERPADQRQPGGSAALGANRADTTAEPLPGPGRQ